LVLRRALTSLSRQNRLRTFASHNRVAQGMARRFVAGETLADALEAVRSINLQGMSVTLDHLGENVGTAAEAAAAAEEYCRILREVARAGLDCNVSLKLTHMGLDLGEPIAFENAGRVVAQAAESGNFVRIDMESSEYTDRTLDIVFRLFERHNNVGTVVQACLYRTERDLERLIKAGIRIRLVKGAYLEPPAVAFEDKAEVDRNYVHLMKVLLSRGTYPAIATHDPDIIDETEQFARRQRIDRTRFEFQMLYGIRRDLQAMLARQGYPMRVYVPFGVEWYPYLMRRMAERPANLMFVVGNIVREARGGRV
jgi:proline dehydrogenase